MFEERASAGDRQRELSRRSRIGLDIYRRNGNIVYAVVESEESGIYRSDEKGENWVKMSNTNASHDFSQVRIDRNNDQRIWEDGGKTFVTKRVSRIHVDFHAIWIDPSNSNNMIVGCDGVIHFSHDAGKSWDSRDNVAIAQFYEISYDMAQPYKVCGGLQDNNTWCGPSSTTSNRGITNDDWYTGREATASMRPSIRRNLGSCMRSRRTAILPGAIYARTKPKAFGSKRDFDGHDFFLGANPPSGAMIDFWSKTTPAPKDVKIAIPNPAGKQVATIKPAAFEAGLNRVVWNLRADRIVPPHNRKSNSQRAWRPPVRNLPFSADREWTRASTPCRSPSAPTSRRRNSMSRKIRISPGSPPQTALSVGQPSTNWWGW